MMMMIMIIVEIIVSIIILCIFLDNSTNLSLLDRIYNYVRDNKVRDSIYVDVYSDTNDISTGRDTRFAIVRPLNWYILNSQSHVYVNAMATYNTNNHINNYCHNGSKFLKLNNPSAGEQALQHIYVVCLPFTVSSMLLHFMNKPKSRIYIKDPSLFKRNDDNNITTGNNTITVIDVINHLLSRGAIINHLLEKDDKTKNIIHITSK